MAKVETEVDPILAGRMSNLAEANKVRSAKATFKNDLGKLDQVEACRLLADRVEHDPDGIVGRLTVSEVFLSVNGIGKSKAKLLARAADRLSLVVKVRDLPEFRRRELARVLRERASDVEPRRAAA